MFTSCAQARVWLLQDLQIPEVKRLAAEATMASSEVETQRLWQQVGAHSAVFPVALLVHAFVDDICWECAGQEDCCCSIDLNMPWWCFPFRQWTSLGGCVLGPMARSHQCQTAAPAGC